MKSNFYAVLSRRETIRTWLVESGSLSVFEMSDRLGVSASTIRRDLAAIEDGGMLRIHGGMKIAREERAFEEKNTLSSGIKDAIAERAMAMIEPGQTVFMNGGTTTLALFRKIKDQDICIITNNIATTGEGETGRAELILVGGQYRSKSRSLVGGIAAASLAQAYAQICFLGANGVSPGRGLTTLLHPEAEVNRAMAKRAKRVVCLADGSKIGVDAGFVSLPIDQVSTLVTDSGADPRALELLAKQGVEVILAEKRL